MTPKHKNKSETQILAKTIIEINCFNLAIMKPSIGQRTVVIPSGQDLLGKIVEKM